jgi:hypothetical protein
MTKNTASADWKKTGPIFKKVAQQLQSQKSQNIYPKAIFETSTLNHLLDFKPSTIYHALKLII